VSRGKFIAGSGQGPDGGNPFAIVGKDFRSDGFVGICKHAFMLMNCWHASRIQDDESSTPAEMRHAESFPTPPDRSAFR
jgi:hypothetical protein